jgi:beta-glucanase (GH16 family)/outer membrane protein assembly factor BamB
MAAQRLLPGAVLAAVLVLAGPAPGSAQGWSLVWSDEFATPGEVDLTNWVYDVGGGGWGNNELQYYQPGTLNASVAAGVLTIQARRETVGGHQYTSARLKTKDRRHFGPYGKIDGSLAGPLDKGLWPAFWMLGTNIDSVPWPACGEIDIMEHVNSDTVVHGTIHWDFGGYASYTAASPSMTTFTSFHSYAVTWDASQLNWYLDGVNVGAADILGSINGTDEFHRPHFVLLNFAVGGNWPGPPNGSTTFPANYRSEYVRWYRWATPAPTPTPIVSALTVTSQNTQNTIEWLNPAIGASYVATRIQYTIGAPCTYPSGPFDGTNLVRQIGTAGVHDSVVHGGLTNGTTYCYAAFVEQPGPTFGAGVTASGRPFATSGVVRWSYNTDAALMAPPGIGPSGVIVCGNDRLCHSVARGAAGAAGLWAGSWSPPVLGGPAQHRPAMVTTSVVPGSTRVSFLGAQDGFVQAIDGATGAVRWTTSAALGEGVQAAPAGMFTAFGGNVNQILVGTRNTVSPVNRLWALDAATGAVIGSFDNGGGAGGIGIITGLALDYPGRRVYFTSRAAASPNTLWCLQVTPAGPTATCPGWTHRALGDIDSGPVLKGSRLYIGNNTGLVRAVDAASGAPLWSFATGDGPVKGFVFPDPFSTKLYFATTNRVWGIQDNGVVAASAWPSVAVPNPSIALYTPGGTKLLVGSSDGRLYQLEMAAATPAVPPTVQSVVIGDGSGIVGSPAFDSAFNMVYVGSDAGVLYAVQLPLP